MGMSEQEEARQIAAYATDISSLESTDESIHNSDSEYDADDVLAQRVYDDDDEPVVQYLVKYTDYPLYRCTWEPKAHLRPQLYQSWKNKGRTIGTEKRDEEGLVNIKMFNEAVAKANIAKSKRREKRKAAREDERARKAAKREEKENAMKKKGIARKTTPSNRTLHTSANENNNKSGAPIKYKRPIVASSDNKVEGQANHPGESSDNTISDNEHRSSLLVKLKVKIGREEGGSNAKDHPPPSLSKLTQNSTMAVPASDSSKLHASQHKRQTANRSSSMDVIERRKPTQVGVVPVISIQGDASSVVSSAVRRISLPNGSSNGGEVHVPRDTGPIKIVYQPKSTPKIRHDKDVKDENDKPFQTLKARGLAEKRSRVEGTPDFKQLYFVNGTPPEPSKTSMESTPEAQKNNNIYGRREPGSERSQKPIFDEHANQTICDLSLRSYEKGKLPIMCYEWSRGLTCDFGPERCFYLHREKDEAGNPLPVNHGPGIPPKHRSPPEMCFYWFRGNNCRKLEHECGFAHENTGYLPVNDSTGELQTVDLKIQPANAEAREVCAAAWSLNMVGAGFELTDTVDEREHQRLEKTARVARHSVLPKHADQPLTCYFWLRGVNGCSRSDDQCKFAHENTGRLAVLNGPDEQIDPKEVPQSSLRLPLAFTGSKNPAFPYSNPTLPLHLKTCFFWNEYMCRETEKDCRSLHRYTGWVADPPAAINWQRQIPVNWQQRLRDEPEAKPHDLRRKSTLSDLDTLKPLLDYPSSPSEHSASSDRIHATQRNESEINPELQLLLDYKEMFSCNGGRRGDIVVDPNVLLFYNPKQHTKEHATITHWLSSNNVQNVFHYWMGPHDEWYEFKDLILAGGSGIIIAHPEFEEEYSSLPGFGDVLRGMVRLWAVGDQQAADFSIWDAKTSKDLHLDRFEIFPHGGIIYLTDDVFMKTPQLALRIVEHFIDVVDAGRRVDGYFVPGMYVNDGMLLWRLGVRPDLLRWIGDICMNQQSELEQGDPDIGSLNALYVLLTDSMYCEPDSSITKLPTNNRRLDYYPIISTSQEFAEDIGLYYKAREVSQHDANTDMAHHYSGLVVVERRLYRSYFVVHPEPQQVDWKETITNIDEIMTPERCIEYFEQDPEGNRFENYAWMYPEKRADSLTS